MSKYSRKVRTWGALPEYVEHRNKAGKVTARTGYFEGKAYTTHVPAEPAYTRPGYRQSRSTTTGSSGVGGVVLVAGIVVILVIAFMGWLFTLLAGALQGFWPIVGGVVSWAAVACATIALAVTVFAAWHRISWDGVSIGRVLLPIVQLAWVALMVFPTIAVVTNPNSSESSDEAWLMNTAIGASLVLAVVSILGVLILAFADGAAWLWVVPGMLVLFAVYVFISPLHALSLPALFATAAVIVRSNLGALD